RRARHQSNPASGMPQNAYPVYLGKLLALHEIEFPTPGRHLDYSAILTLRNAFAVFQRDDLLSDLQAHIAKPANAADADPSAALLARLELSALSAWSDDKEGAVRELKRTVELAPKDPDLKLDLAELYAQQRDLDEAMKTVESVEALDQGVTRRRELLT